jgi:hypothetical protein
MSFQKSKIFNLLSLSEFRKILSVMHGDSSINMDDHRNEDASNSGLGVKYGEGYKQVLLTG